MNKTPTTLAPIGEPESTQDPPCRNTTPAKRRRVPPVKAKMAPSKKGKYNICITHHLHNVEVRNMDTEMTKLLGEQENELQKATVALQAELAGRESMNQLILDQISKTKAVEEIRKELHTLESVAGGGQHGGSCVDISGLSEKVDLTRTKDVNQGQSKALCDTLQQLEAAKEQIKDCKDQISAFSRAHAKHLEEKETARRQQDEEKIKQECESLELELSEYKSKLKSNTETSNRTIQSWKDIATRAREDALKAIKANNLEVEQKRTAYAQEAERELQIKLEATKRQYETQLSKQQRETDSVQSKLNTAEYGLLKKELAFDREVQNKLEATRKQYDTLLTKQGQETEALQSKIDDYNIDLWDATNSVRTLKEEKKALEESSAQIKQSVKRLSEDVRKSKSDLEMSKFHVRTYNTRLNESNSSLVTMVEVATLQMGRYRILTRDLQSKVGAILAYRNTITELKSTIDKLEDRLRQQDGNLSALNDVDVRNRRLKEENERLRKRVAAITKVQDENRSLRRAQKELQKQVDNGVTRDKALTTQCDELQEHILQQDSKIRELNVSNKDFSEKEEKTAAESAIMANKLVCEERKIEELTRELNSRDNEIRDRDRSISTKDQEIKALKSTLVRKEQDATLKIGELNNAKAKEIKILKSTLAQNKEDATLKLGELEDAKDEEIEKLKITLAQNKEDATLKLGELKHAKDEEIKKLKSTLAQNEEHATLKLGELREDLANSERESSCMVLRRDQRIQELEGTLVRDHADAVQKLEELERDLAAINQEMNKKEDTVRKQEQHIQELELDSTLTQVYALEEIADLKQEITTATATVGKFAAELSLRNDEIRTHQSHILANDNQIQQLELSLQQAHDAANNKISILEEKVEATNIAISQLHSDLEVKNSELLSKESTITSNKERIEQLEHTRSNLLADLDQSKQRQKEFSCILDDKERVLDTLMRDNSSQLSKIKDLNEAKARLLHEKELAMQRADKVQFHLSETKSAISQLRSDVQQTQEQFQDFVDQRQGREIKERVQIMHQLAIASIHAYAWGGTRIDDIAAGLTDVQSFFSLGGNDFGHLVHIHKLHSERRALIIIHHEDGTELVFHNQVRGFAFLESLLPADHHIRIDHGPEKSPTYLQLQGDPLQPHAAMRQWLNETLVRQ